MTTTDVPALTIQADADEELAQLHARFADSKATLDEAKKNHDALVQAIKVRLNAAAPEERKLELVGTGGPALRLVYAERTTFDTTRLKRDQPALYRDLFEGVGGFEGHEPFKKITGSWTLSVAKGGA